MKIRIILAVLGLMGLMGLSTASYAQDAEKGAKVFNKCMACHAIDDKNKIGPSLKGVVGRWDEATLAAYLPDPKAFVPGTKMTFPGLKNPEDVADVIAYLKTKGM